MSRNVASRIPALLLAKGWSDKDFIGECIKRGLSIDTAQRLARGDTKTTVRTLALIAEMLEVGSLCELMDIENGKHRTGE